MSLRKEWAGTICLAPGTPFAPVEAVKGASGKAPASPFKDLCACHHEALDRSHRCATTLQPPSGKVAGVQRPDGSWVVVGEAELALVKQQLKTDEFTPLAYPPVSEVALDQASANYWLQAPKDQPGFLPFVGALYWWLDASQRALVGKVSIRGRQYRVAVHASNGLLCMARLRYANELDEPSSAVLAPGQMPAPNEAYVQMIDGIAAQFPATFDIRNEQDESKAQLDALAARVLAGPAGGEPTPSAAPEAVSDVPDLMDALKAAMGDKRAPAKARKAATPAKEAAKA